MVRHLMHLMVDNMTRVKVEWRSASKSNYELFKKKHPSIELTYNEWKKIIYTYNEMYKIHLLETGDKAKFPYGFGEFAVGKKKRKKIITHNGEERINLPIDWKKTKEKGKIIYNFNYHTEGFYFGWQWFRDAATFKHSTLWHFKPYRLTSRLITTYVNSDDKYQHIYKQWNL